MKCHMCGREVKEEVSEDGLQVDYICPIHGNVGGSISSIGYRESKKLDVLKAIATAFCFGSFYLNFIHSKFIMAFFMLSWGILNQTEELYEIFSYIDHLINRSEDDEKSN